MNCTLISTNSLPPPSIEENFARRETMAGSQALTLASQTVVMASPKMGGASADYLVVDLDVSLCADDLAERVVSPISPFPTTAPSTAAVAYPSLVAAAAAASPGGPGDKIEMEESDDEVIDLTQQQDSELELEPQLKPEPVQESEEEFGPQPHDVEAEAEFVGGQTQAGTYSALPAASAAVAGPPPATALASLEVGDLTVKDDAVEMKGGEAAAAAEAGTASTPTLLKLAAPEHTWEQDADHPKCK